MRILITGASGLLGTNVAIEAAALGHEVTGVIHRTPIKTGAFNVQTANLLETGAVDRLLERIEPDWVIHCAALANLESCEQAPQEAWLINCQLPGILAEKCRQGGARLLHVSTDAVFDGKKGDYSETDTPNPLSAYAQTKLDGELAVASVNQDALIARVNLFGFSPLGKRSLAEFFLNNLQARKPVNGFTDVFFCPLLVNDIARIFLRMLELELKGLYHVFSSECLSKYSFGVQIAGRFGFDANLIAPKTLGDSGLTAARAPNLTMRTEKLSAALGEPPPAFQPMLDRFFALYESGYPQKLIRMTGEREVDR